MTHPTPEPNEKIRLLRLTPQELINLGELVAFTYSNMDIAYRLFQQLGITEGQLADLALKIKKEVDRL